MTKNTIITRARRVALCKITSGAVSSIPAITQIAFGDGGVDSSGEPTAPLETQTALNHEVARYPIDGVTYPIDTTARYAATIPENDLTGVKISEAALVDADGVLAAIKNVYAKQKDAEVIFTFELDEEF